MSAAEKLAPAKERPILFSAPMVRALLEGRKTQTRRMVKVRKSTDHLILASPYAASLCPYGQPGDRLWVRETFVYRDKHDRFYYRADHPVYDPYAHNGWKPSIHMPRRASRLTLEVTGVRVERLQDIPEEDAKVEGAAFHEGGGVDHSGWRHDLSTVYASARHSFFALWASINGEASLNANPWCWVVEFRRLP